MAPPTLTPFGTKGRSECERARSATAQRRGDAVEMNKSHPPQSPFLRKGEGSPEASAWIAPSHDSHAATFNWSSTIERPFLQ
jgi:hypothetical protein